MTQIPAQGAIADRPAALLGDIRRFIEGVSTRRLDNGLDVHVASDRRSPLVACAVAYRAGTRDEDPAYGGVAHFLEHMMFKGAERFGAGEIDRLTQAAGGVNNAFTSHDSTLYYFTFAADRWRLALDIESDRMAGLNLAAEDVEAERQVIHEEISMYEGEPWDMLLRGVQAAAFGRHPYGRPILGTRATLDAIGAEQLRQFHRRFYRPSNAAVVVVGDVDVDAAHAAIAERFTLPSPPAPERPSPPAAERGARRVERHQGELARLEVALPTPPVTDPDHAVLRLLCSVLTLGRSSRLHRLLVDDQQLALWVSADAQQTLDPGVLGMTAEAVPGRDPGRLEAGILDALRELVDEPPSSAELARARQLMMADWLFGHERLEQRAFLLGGASALADLALPVRSMERLLNATPDELLRVAGRYLRPERAVIGWSWPEAGDADDGEPDR
ncbi:MAG: pitrilysin family protein [Acidobacteriota bacterium]